MIASELYRITFDHDMRGGRPCVRGMRVALSDILSLPAAGDTIEDILAAFRFIEKGDIYAALKYGAKPRMFRVRWYAARLKVRFEIHAMLPPRFEVILNGSVQPGLPELAAVAPCKY